MLARKMVFNLNRKKQSKKQKYILKTNGEWVGGSGRSVYSCIDVVVL